MRLLVLTVIAQLLVVPAALALSPGTSHATLSRDSDPIQSFVSDEESSDDAFAAVDVLEDDAEAPNVSPSLRFERMTIRPRSERSESLVSPRAIDRPPQSV